MNYKRLSQGTTLNPAGPLEAPPADTAPSLERASLLLLATALALLFLGLVGWRATPVGADGRPYLLTGQNRALLAYVKRSAAWLKGLEQCALMLRELEELAGGDVFLRSQRAQAVMDSSAHLYAQIERTKVPSPLRGLHERYRQAATLALSAGERASTWALTQNQEDKARLQETRAALEAAIEELRQLDLGGRYA